MSLSGAIDRIARIIRQEAKRNPEFARRLEAALALHASRRPAPEPEETLEEAPAAATILNPIAIFSREGEEALAAALAPLKADRAAMLALISEHNLDPAGEAAGLKGAALLAFVIAQAKKRVERDKKLFDY